MISQERQWKVFRDKDDLDCGGRIGRISLGIGRSGECEGNIVESGDGWWRL